MTSTTTTESASKPVQTVYLSNLPDKLSKDKLRRQLFNLLSRFGPVLDICIKKTKQTRGQAWAVFSTVESATRSISTLQRYPFFGKEMRLDFAKENADVVAKLQGQFVQKKREPKLTAAVTTAAEGGEFQPPPKKARVEEGETNGGGHDSNNPPGPLLKTDNLPAETTSQQLEDLFARYEGFLEVRLAQGKFVAFIEYKTVDQARVAREGLKGHQLTPHHRLRVNYAKQ
ncbi:hypothetical protein BASA81_005149 [Batrachochytrium salamandrivorans]|nr:hypothetical protein BASA81_005149 [Batrachochytrium salamandrivorans]